MFLWYTWYVQGQPTPVDFFSSLPDAAKIDKETGDVITLSALKQIVPSFRALAVSADKDLLNSLKKTAVSDRFNFVITLIPELEDLRAKAVDELKESKLGARTAVELYKLTIDRLGKLHSLPIDEFEEIVDLPTYALMDVIEELAGEITIENTERPDTTGGNAETPFSGGESEGSDTSS